MEAIAEVETRQDVVAREKAPDPARGRPKAKNFRFPVRQAKREVSPAEAEANRLLIADFIARKGVTRCPPGYAAGAVQTQYDFI